MTYVASFLFPDATLSLFLPPPLQQVLIIHGRFDAAVPLSNSVRLAAMLPGSSLVQLPTCGHVPQEEDPVAFADAVVKFMSDLPEARESIPAIGGHK